MSRQPGHTDRTAEKALAETQQQMRIQRRKINHERNRSTNEMYWANLSQPARESILAALETDQSKKLIAREHKHSHSFIMYIWRNHR